MAAVLENRIHTVPEHSAAFMRAVSGGEIAVYGGYPFYRHDSWLVAIGYPLEGEYDPAAFENALHRAVKENNARECWAAAPYFSPRYAAFVTEKDAYYVLDAHSPIPSRLKNSVRNASRLLRIEEGRVFTAGHRKLWAEFLARKELTLRVRELFARLPSVLAAPETDIRFLNAWDDENNLAACLVLDYAPKEFSVYVIGAHSRLHYTPHAVDALFAAMLENARREGKGYIHLGLGVNDGIRRFKEKWGGKRSLPYQAAYWKTHTEETADTSVTALRDVVMLSLPVLGGEREHFAENGLPNELPEERPFAMLWKLEKNGKTSWIGGSAHAFRYSFVSSFKKLFRKTDTVIFEGPLDAASMAAFARHGKTRDKNTPRIADYLTEKEIRRLEDIVCGPRGKLAAFCNMVWENSPDVRRILAEHRPWSVFFSLHYAFLSRHGWTKSVDLEAWETARAMRRNVIAMESMEEQISSLESVPLERIIRFLQQPETWEKRMRKSLDAYLAGDLEKMLGTGAEFPSRTESVIGMRDHIFRERMRPFLEQGRTAVFVGTAHMLNLETMLREDGFTVTKLHPTWRHHLRSRLRGAS